MVTFPQISGADVPRSFLGGTHLLGMVAGPPFQDIRCRANMAHIRQSMPNSGLRVKTKVLKTCQVVLFSLGSGLDASNRCFDSASTMKSRRGVRNLADTFCINIDEYDPGNARTDRCMGGWARNIIRMCRVHASASRSVPDTRGKRARHAEPVWRTRAARDTTMRWTHVCVSNGHGARPRRAAGE